MPKHWTLTRCWVLVWMMTKYLARPSCMGISSSFCCQLLARAWEARCFAKFLARPQFGRAGQGSIQTAPKHPKGWHVILSASSFFLLTASNFSRYIPSKLREYKLDATNKFNKSTCNQIFSHYASWSQTNQRSFLPKHWWVFIGHNPNINNLPNFWSCPCIGHAKIFVGQFGAQTKEPLKSLGSAPCYEAVSKHFLIKIIFWPYLSSW